MIIFDMIIETVFTNFIASENLNLDNRSLEKFCREIQISSQGRKVSNQNGFQSDNIDLKSQILTDFTLQINKLLTEVHDGCELKSNHTVKITQAWININDKNSSNTLHNHPNSIFSGVYYVKVPKDSGDIIFVNPNNLLSYTLYPDMVENYNAFNSGKWRITPSEGKVIIFPSWLNHYVDFNNNEDERISIAFNTEFV